MPLFRFHRSSLEDSLKTTIVVKTLNDVVKAFIFSDVAISANTQWDASFLIEPYPNKNDNFDPRIGWFTHIVKTNLYEENKMVPIGYLSESLEN